MKIILSIILLLLGFWLSIGIAIYQHLGTTIELDLTPKDVEV